MKKIWLVPHPTSQFQEDVKSLATRNGLRIVDAKYKADYPKGVLEAKPPKLTPVSEDKE